MYSCLGSSLSEIRVINFTKEVLMYKNRLICFFVLLILNSMAYSESRYFICGPDEDGCDLNDARYCACIPYDEFNFANPYCLDFNKMRCEPLANVPDCPSALVFKDQGTCFSTIFQSTSSKPCVTTTLKFCQESHAWLCDVTGDPTKCRKL